YTFLLLCICGLLLAGCDENDMESLVPVTEGSLCFSVRVNDGGYTPTGIHTRATDNSDYTTTFTPGDRIGVFAVKDGSIDNRVNNLCLTATSSGGGGSSLTWQDADGKAPLYVAGATYYAYYPYQETLTGDLAPNPTIPGGAAPDAAGFFADVVSAWTPSTAQGTYAEYTAQDLMIACGTLSDKSLTFSMTHQMALVVIDLPRTRYSFSNTSPTIPDYSIDAPDTKFTGFSPCRMDAGTYRYLLNPSVSSSSPATLSGSYTNAQGQTSEWSFTASAGTGTYNVYQVDNAAVKEIKDYELQAGDFYMKDGSLLAKTTDLTDTQKTACSGIVFWLGDIKSDNYGLLDSKFSSGGTHGLVVSLWDMPAPDNASSSAMIWTYGGYEYVDNWLGSKNGITCTWNGKPTSFASIQETDKMQGYANTLALIEYNKYVEGQTGDGYGPQGNKRVKPVKGLAAFQDSHPTPSNSSGWYWPSVCELKYVCWGQDKSKGVSGKDDLNAQFQKVNVSTFGGNYWSSTESGTSSAWNVDFYGGGEVRGDGYKYHYGYCVRPLLAF
ncbi:fimbrillin family protein, partial [Parabacteroides sp.]